MQNKAGDNAKKLVQDTNEKTAKEDDTLIQEGLIQPEKQPTL